MPKQVKYIIDARPEKEHQDGLKYPVPMNEAELLGMFDQYVTNRMPYGKKALKNRCVAIRKHLEAKNYEKVIARWMQLDSSVIDTMPFSVLRFIEANCKSVVIKMREPDPSINVDGYWYKGIVSVSEIDAESGKEILKMIYGF